MKEIITSIENQKIKNIRKLLENKNILKEKKFIIENDNLIEEAYKNEMLLEAYALIDYDNYLNLDLIYVSEKVMKSISDLKNAIEAYKKAIKILKNDYDSIYNLALAYHLMGNTQDAGKYYCEAINIQPMNYEAHYNLAICYEEGCFCNRFCCSCNVCCCCKCLCRR